MVKSTTGWTNACFCLSKSQVYNIGISVQYVGFITMQHPEEIKNCFGMQGFVISRNRYCTYILTFYIKIESICVLTTISLIVLLTNTPVKAGILKANPYYYRSCMIPWLHTYLISTSLGARSPHDRGVFQLVSMLRELHLYLINYTVTLQYSNSKTFHWSIRIRVPWVAMTLLTPLTLDKCLAFLATNYRWH